MRKHLVIAGLFAAAAIAPLPASAGGAPQGPQGGAWDRASGGSLGGAGQVGGGQLGEASVDEGCLGEPGSWVPGTLQIDGPTASAGANPPAPASGDEAGAYDCALV